jgi:hypothetical protein
MVHEMHNYVQKILLILLVKKGNIEPILWFKKREHFTTFNNGCLGSLYSMTNVANYDNLCELQNNVNHRDFERK